MVSSAGCGDKPGREIEMDGAGAQLLTAAIALRSAMACIVDAESILRVLGEEEVADPLRRVAEALRPLSAALNTRTTK